MGQTSDCGNGATLPTHWLVQVFLVCAAYTSGNTRASSPRRPVVPHSVWTSVHRKDNVTLLAMQLPAE